MFVRGVGYVGPEIKSVLPDDRTATATDIDTDIAADGGADAVTQRCESVTNF